MNKSYYDVYYKILTGSLPFKTEYGGSETWFWTNYNIPYDPFRFMGIESGFWEKYAVKSH